MPQDPYQTPASQTFGEHGSPAATGLSAEDASHLKLLSIFHYIVGGIGVLTSLLPCVHLVFGILMVNGTFPGGGQGPPPEFGWLVIAFALCAILIGLTFSVLTIFVGQRIASRENHLLCLINAGIQCLFIPLGTALGVFTFVVLLRPQVRALFEQKRG